MVNKIEETYETKLKRMKWYLYQLPEYYAICFNKEE